MHVLRKHGAHVTSTIVYGTRVCCHSYVGESQSSRPMEVQVGPALLRDEKNMYNISSDRHRPHQRSGYSRRRIIPYLIRREKGVVGTN